VETEVGVELVVVLAVAMAVAVVVLTMAAMVAMVLVEAVTWEAGHQQLRRRAGRDDGGL
jgi:uncharacterized protein (DUF2062 family)